MQYIIGLAIIIGILYLVIMLIIFLVKVLVQALFIILGVGAGAGLAVGGFYGVKGYLKATRDEINNKALKIAMIAITGVFVLGLLGAIVYLVAQGVK